MVLPLGAHPTGGRLRGEARSRAGVEPWAALASFAIVHGASEATAVDHDLQILAAGQLVAEALAVEVSFRQVDLAGRSPWEEELPEADIVIAMSLLHWLPDPARALSFLGRYPEILYEGHDPLAVELARLESIGFDRPSVVMETERGRRVLHASKR